jgi:hypothetical protein
MQHEEIRLFFLDIRSEDISLEETPIFDWQEAELNTLCRDGWTFKAVMPGPDDRGYLIFFVRETK